LSALTEDGTSIGQESCHQKNRTLTAEDLTRIMVDVTEINTQRSRKNQREYYSGKKKRHTSKKERDIILQARFYTFTFRRKWLIVVAMHEFL
jgi:hypothetical protein